VADEELKDRVLSLTNSDLNQNDRLDELEEALEALRVLLEGRSEDRDDNGLKGDMHELTRRLNKLEALMAPDSIGEGGIINRLKRLEKRAGFEEKESEHRWKFWASLVGALALVAAAIIPNLDKIEKFFEPKSSIQAPAPKKRVVKVRRIVLPPVESENDE